MNTMKPSISLLCQQPEESQQESCRLNDTPLIGSEYEYPTKEQEGDKNIVWQFKDMGMI